MLYLFRKDGRYIEGENTKHCDKLAVNSLAFYQVPAGCSTIFVGRKDGSIAVYTLGDVQPIQTIKAHKLNGNLFS